MNYTIYTRLTFVLIIFLINFSSHSFGQDSTALSEEEILGTFEEIKKTDQTHLKEPEIRKQIFIDNFNTILGIIESHGYPVFEETKQGKKNTALVRTATNTTFFHILQTNPHLLLNHETIEQIRIEIEASRMNSFLLRDILWMFQYAADCGNVEPWTEEIRTNFYHAFQAWNIKLYGESKSKSFQNKN